MQSASSYLLEARIFRKLFFLAFFRLAPYNTSMFARLQEALKIHKAFIYVDNATYVFILSSKIPCLSNHRT
jgi:hypothetical protein